MNVIGTALGAGHSIEIDGLLATAKVLGGAEISVLGRDELVDRLYAATVLGFAAHFDDFDDTHLETVIHPGAATMGALYSLGLVREVPPEVALMAMALGVEAQLRIGLAMTPSHYDLGWHITGTCGVVGAAVAAGVVFGFDAQKLCDAMGIAMSMTVGQREAFGTPIKPYHAGKAASNGILAAMLAGAGVEAPVEILTDEKGYFAALSDLWSTDWIDPLDLGRRWVILDNTYKPFPCGIVAHPAIEAATLLHPRLIGIADDQIARVSVACNPLVVELMGRPSASTGLEARFCAIHGVTVGLLTGKGGLLEFSDMMSTDDRVVSVRNRTTLEPDDVHSRQAATVTVHFTDGTTLVESVEAAMGSRERPLTDEQLRAKFLALVEPYFPERAEQIFACALALGETSITDIDHAVRG